jgi:hypothetical protein
MNIIKRLLNATPTEIILGACFLAWSYMLAVSFLIVLSN